MLQPNFRKKLGCNGEQIAEKWLVERGYKLVMRNFTMFGGQIDLIMNSPQGNLVFIEVKTRSVEHTGQQIEQKIGIKQILTLRRAAKHFLENNSIHFKAWQFDLLWITFSPASGGKPPLAKIRHYKDVLAA